MQTCNCLW